jgi:hypothetical protein
MRTHGPYHGSRLPALPGGVVAVAAFALLVFSPPVSAGSTAELPEPPSALRASDGPPAAPEQALHRVHSGAAVRLAHMGGGLPAPVQPVAAARGDGRPGDVLGVALATSGPPLRVLFCTWLN